MLADRRVGALEVVEQGELGRRRPRRGQLARRGPAGLERAIHRRQVVDDRSRLADARERLDLALEARDPRERGRLEQRAGRIGLDQYIELVDARHALVDRAVGAADRLFAPEVPHALVVDVEIASQHESDATEHDRDCDDEGRRPHEARADPDEQALDVGRGPAAMRPRHGAARARREQGERRGQRDDGEAQDREHPGGREEPEDLEGRHVGRRGQREEARDVRDRRDRDRTHDLDHRAHDELPRRRPGIAVELAVVLPEDVDAIGHADRDQDDGQRRRDQRVGRARVREPADGRRDAAHDDAEREQHAARRAIGGVQHDRDGRQRERQHAAGVGVDVVAEMTRDAALPRHVERLARARGRLVREGDDPAIGLALVEAIVDLRHEQGHARVLAHERAHVERHRLDRRAHGAGALGRRRRIFEEGLDLEGLVRPGDPVAARETRHVRAIDTGHRLEAIVQPLDEREGLGLEDLVPGRRDDRDDDRIREAEDLPHALARFEGGIAGRDERIRARVLVEIDEPARGGQDEERTDQQQLSWMGGHPSKEGLRSRLDSDHRTTSPSWAARRIAEPRGSIGRRRSAPNRPTRGGRKVEKEHPPCPMGNLRSTDPAGLPGRALARSRACVIRPLPFAGLARASRDVRAESGRLDGEHP